MFRAGCWVLLPPWLSLFLTGTTTIEKYDLRTNSWIQIGTMNGRRLQFGVAVIDNKLYIVGGRDGLKTSNIVECFNPVTKAWTVMPPMSTHRHGLGKRGFASANNSQLTQMLRKLLTALSNTQRHLQKTFSKTDLLIAIILWFYLYSRNWRWSSRVNFARKFQNIQNIN